MKIALQLYSCRDKLGSPQDQLQVLEQVAEMGYDGVEFFCVDGQTPYGTMDPHLLRDALKETGLEGLNVHLHLPLEKWFGGLEQALSYAKEVGLSAITLPYLPPELRQEDVHRRLIDQFPHIAEQCRNYGLHFLYHNHDFEMEPGMGFPTLLEALTEPEGVRLELDTFWAFFKGQSPTALMERLGSKLTYIHVKDYLELSDFWSMQFTAIGTGIMDNAAIVKKAEQMRLPWVVVEQDNSSIDTLESARQSVVNLKKEIR